jgi:hypothetical protein
LLVEANDEDVYFFATNQLRNLASRVVTGAHVHLRGRGKKLHDNVAK